MPAPTSVIVKPKRRWWRWILLGIIICVLVGGYLGLKQFFHSRGTKEWIEAQYRKRLPGELRIGRIEWKQPLLFVLHDVSLGREWTLLGGAQEPLVTCQEVGLQLGLVEGELRPTVITIQGIRLRLDRDSYRFLNEVVDKEATYPPTGPPKPLQIEASGEVVIASGLVLSGVQARIDALGPMIRGPVTGRLGNESFRLDLSSERTPGGARRYTYSVVQAKAELAPVFDAVALLGIVGEVGPEVRRWLPKVVDASGSVVVHDPQARIYDGAVQATWTEAPGQLIAGNGTGRAELHIDPQVVRVSRIELRDSGLGEIEPGGKVTVERGPDLLTADCRIRRPGSRLPIPRQISADEAAKLLPRLTARVPMAKATSDPMELRLFGNVGSELLLRWPRGRPGALRIEGKELPLGPAQGFLPEGMTIAGGRVASLVVDIESGGLRALDLGASQARLGWQGWTLGPTDGRLVLTPWKDGGLSFIVDLTAPGQAGPLSVARFTWDGRSEAVSLSLISQAVEGLIARLHGPTVLPELRGGVDLKIALAQAEATPGGRKLWRGAIERCRATGLALGDLLRGVDLEARGELTVDDQLLGLRGGGQLKAGELLLGQGQWRPAAAQLPIFAITLERQPGRITLSELLARAAGPGGEPLPGGWTAQLAGTIDDQKLAGTLDGVVDHVELIWLLDLAGITALRCTGQGASSLTVTLDGLKPVAIAGSFLPLGAAMAAGPLTASGITGEIRFRFARDAPEEKP